MGPSYPFSGGGGPILFLPEPEPFLTMVTGLLLLAVFHRRRRARFVVKRGRRFVSWTENSGVDFF